MKVAILPKRWISATKLVGILAVLSGASSCASIPSATKTSRKMVYTAPSGMRFVFIPPHTYRMGGEFSDIPPTPVRVSGFWMSETLITNQEIERVMPDYKRIEISRNDDQPAVGITYKPIMKAISSFSKADKLPYLLPSEAQWEAACRAGLDQKHFAWGNSEPDRKAQNMELETAPVKKFPPNGFGIYDAGTNLDQLVREADYERTAAYFRSPDPVGPLEGENRLARGGSHSLITPLINSRGMVAPDPIIWQLVGFRLVLEDDHRIRSKAKPESFSYLVDP